MKKQLLSILALCFVGMLCSAQTVTPVLQPHQTFVDQSGLACAGCSLYSYVGGTTTPQPTFTDSTGTVQNTNPIVLDPAGGANIWVTSTTTYKFALYDASGTVIWTVDNVKSNGGGSLPCTTPYAVQIANAGATALTCDPTITVNPTSHTLMVGGAISGNAFTLKNLGTITAPWTFDITSPSTALNSLGAIPLSDLATQTPDTIVSNASGSSASPTAVPLPSGCTTGVNYSTSTHSWTCSNSVVSLSSLALQAPNTVVMNATGSNASPTAVPMPTGCTNGVNYSTTTNAWTCAAPSTTTCSGTTVPWTCYSLYADGTVEEYGEFFVYPSGNPYNTATVYFPHSFSSIFEVIGQTLGVASGSGDPTTPPCETLQSKSLTSATWFMARCIVAGAGGGNFDSTMTMEWHAKGKQ